MKNVTPSNLNPTLGLFIKLTAIVAIAIVVLIVAAFLLKIVLIAAVVAAICVGGFLIYNLIRRRSKLPVIR
jgi:UDP-N-acetylmuramyl pentapeptide phosphotransferase/UDP-N-acetylglucosamine-1-phosphate transferase